MIVLLDTGPLGKLTNPKGTGEPAECTQWLRDLVAAGVRVLVPEICDYEVRRELLRIDSVKSIERLNDLGTKFGFLPLDSVVMLRAAELWAEARKKGMPAAHDKALDGDVILAAQALEVGAVVATENPGHLNRYVEAKHWRDIKAP